jgi:hypothetical protein
MNFEQGLHYELSSIPGLAKKVFPMNAKEGTTVPFVVYTKSSGDMIMTLSGLSQTRDFGYEIDILAGTYAELQTRFDQVKSKLVSMIGRTIGTGNVLVQSFYIQNVIELFEEEPQWFRLKLESRFYYKEA